MIMKSLLANRDDDTECFVNVYECGLGYYWRTREAAIKVAQYDPHQLIGRLHVRMKRKVYD